MQSNEQINSNDQIVKTMPRKATVILWSLTRTSKAPAAQHQCHELLQMNNIKKRRGRLSFDVNYWYFMSYSLSFEPFD